MSETEGTAGGGAVNQANTGRWRSVTELLALVGPASILTGMLYYFGYISAKAYYAHFGVSLSALNFAPTSYLIRSAGTFFRPAVTLLVAVVGLFVVHHVLGWVMRRIGAGRSRWVVSSLVGLSLVLAGIGLFGIYGTPLGLMAPLALAASVLLLEYCSALVVPYADPRVEWVNLVRIGAAVRRGFVGALVLLASFWAVAVLAQYRGLADAELVERSLFLQPQAVVYSEKDLHLPGPGIAVAILRADNSTYRFRYNGLRPLLYANGRWFLLPAGWKHNNGSTVIVLQDDPARIRVDLAP